MPSKKQRERLLSFGKCAMCGKQPDDGERICESCSQMAKDREKKRRAACIENHLCTTCGKNPPQLDKKTCDTCKKKRQAWLDSKGSVYIDASKAHNLSQRIDRKQRVIDYYGGKCLCCGEDGLSFLTIDHINEDGAEHRRGIASNFNSRVPGGDHFYRWLESNNFPDGFQTLCYNCNIGKHLNGGACPHRSGV